MSKAVFNLNPTVNAKRLFPLPRYHPHYKSRVNQVSAQDQLDGRTWLMVRTENGAFLVFMPTGVVYVTLEVPA